MNLRELLPERSAEDVLAGRSPVTLGGEQYVLRDLPRRLNRDFREMFLGSMGTFFDGIELLDDVTSIVGYLSADSDDRVLVILRWYDTGNGAREGVLPDDDWLDEHATDTELLVTLLAILAASFPLAVAALGMSAVVGLSPMPTPTPSKPPNGRRRRGAGAPTMSKTS